MNNSGLIDQFKTLGGDILFLRKVESRLANLRSITKKLPVALADMRDAVKYAKKIRTILRINFGLEKMSVGHTVKIGDSPAKWPIDYYTPQWGLPSPLEIILPDLTRNLDEIIQFLDRPNRNILKELFPLEDVTEKGGRPVTNLKLFYAIPALRLYLELVAKRPYWDWLSDWGAIFVGKDGWSAQDWWKEAMPKSSLAWGDLPYWTKSYLGLGTEDFIEYLLYHKFIFVRRLKCEKGTCLICAYTNQLFEQTAIKVIRKLIPPVQEEQISRGMRSLSVVCHKNRMKKNYRDHLIKKFRSSSS
ncbi:MAG: hypothetical protein HY399_04740 [Elusimicrobia bacterium]|nr:hypothetical protein [Elusimicrobiota bacterium]